MDTDRRDRLVENLRKKEAPVGGRRPGPTVPLEDFFEGNDDLGRIGCNLSQHPGVDTFHRVLAAIRARGDVQDVLVEIRDLVDQHSWPFSDTIFVLTSMEQPELAKLVSKLHPDEVGQFPAASVPDDLPTLKQGMKVLGVWWD